MTMATVPSNFPSPSSPYPFSQSHCFLILQPQIHFINSFRNLRFRISCSAQTIEIGTQENSPTKKKRKPRPSFLEQIEEKWSLRTTSSREKLPWEEEEIENFAKVGEQYVRSSGVGVSESGSEKSKIVSEEVNLSPRKREYLPPWVHGNKTKTSRFDSEAIDLEKTTENSGNLNGFCERSENYAPSNVVRDLTKLEEKISFHGGSGEKDAKNDDTPIGQVNKAQTLIVKPDKGDKPNNSAVGIFQEFTNSKGPNDARRLPWEKESERESIEGKRLRNSNTKMAEKVIPEPELKRLRNVALRMVERIKVGAAGVTQALVDSIHEKWKEDEVVKLKFEGPPAMKMGRTHEILESRTGGLVIWRSGSSIVLYRGIAYKLDCVLSFNKQTEENAKPSESSSSLVNEDMQRIGVKHFNGAAASSRTDSLKQFNNLSGEELKDLQELNLLLDELGPRFIDWSGREPLPVDADLLPAVVPGYKRPFRLLPHGLRQGLRDKEMTYFRRTVRTMPPHFALGRNKELQGLAMAMVKLWEKCAIAKIAIKRGVQNTSNERMAEELKVLTGGTLLSRNKEYIVFYRGNDFLPPGVTKALVEKEKLSALRQDEEEKARQKAVALIDSNVKVAERPLVAGTLSETKAATSHWKNQPSSEDLEKMMKELAVARHASLVKFLEKKLAIAKGKITKAEKALQKVQKELEPAELPTDLETLSDEERFLFRKIGLSMKTYLLLGRRGVFDGTIENMHLHWKYRELVKIIVEGKNLPQVKHIAISLEAESGGLLVSADKTNKGYAIIIYRGKNYQRPIAFRPKNLLTRRQALARAIELQRREALKHHVSELQGKIEKLKSELEDVKVVKEIDEETLYSRVDDASDDDDLEEDENEEAYLKIYDHDDEEDGIP